MLCAVAINNYGELPWHNLTLLWYCGAYNWLVFTAVYFVIMYLYISLQDDALEETGWKLVHGDVFRPPQYPMLLVACIGSGLQLLCMVLVIIGKCSLVMHVPLSLIHEIKHPQEYI